MNKEGKKKILKENFAKRLKFLMEQHDETTYSIGEMLGMSNSTISRYLNLNMLPKKPTIKELARYFNINPVWLMGYDVSKEINFNNNMSLSPKEKEILRKYRKLPEEEKEKLEGILDVFENNEVKKRDTG